MPTQIVKLGSANGITSTGKLFNLSDLIQESYKVSYTAKKLGNQKLIDLTESHLLNVKKNPTKIKELSEDLDVLKGLVKLGKNQELKDCKEIVSDKKPRKKKIKSSIKPAVVVEESWKNSKDKISKLLEDFRVSSKNKVFYKELDKFNKTIAKGKPITVNEAINLYKASNSCLTHLTVELEKKPQFIDTYKECTKLLSRDNIKLLEAIQSNKVPSRSLLESFISFTNILLESDTSETLDNEVYKDEEIPEEVNLEKLEQEDVLNEEDETTYDDDTIIDEEEESEDFDDEDTEDSLGITVEEDPSVSVDLTSEEIEILKSILNKISGIEESDMVEDEEESEDLYEEDETLDPEHSEEDDIDSEEDEELEEECECEECDDEELEEEDETLDSEEEETLDSEDEEFDEEEEEPEDFDDEDEELDEECDDEELEEDETLDSEEDEELEDVDTDLSESAKIRIKKSFHLQ